MYTKCRGQKVENSSRLTRPYWPGALDQVLWSSDSTVAGSSTEGWRKERVGEVVGGRRVGGLSGGAWGGDQGWGRWGWMPATGLGAPGARTGARLASPHTLLSSGRRAGVGQGRPLACWWATSLTSLWVQMEARAWWSVGVRLVRLVRAAPRGWGGRRGLGKPGGWLKAGLEAWRGLVGDGKAGAGWGGEMKFCIWVGPVRMMFWERWRGEGKPRAGRGSWRGRSRGSWGWSTGRSWWGCTGKSKLGGRLETWVWAR